MVINFVLKKKKNTYVTYIISFQSIVDDFTRPLCCLFWRCHRACLHIFVYIHTYYRITIMLLLLLYVRPRRGAHPSAMFFRLLFSLVPSHIRFIVIIIILISIRRVSMRFESSPRGHTNQTVNYFPRSFFRRHASRSGTCRVPSYGLRRPVAHAIHKRVCANERPRLPKSISSLRANEL